jgi:hypothetical protein
MFRPLRVRPRDLPPRIIGKHAPGRSRNRVVGRTGYVGTSSYRVPDETAGETTQNKTHSHLERIVVIVVVAVAVNNHTTVSTTIARGPYAVDHRGAQGLTGPTMDYLKHLRGCGNHMT